MRTSSIGLLLISAISSSISFSFLISSVKRVQGKRMSSFALAAAPCPLPSGASIIIVGGNRGLGLELAKSCLAGGLKTYVTTRKSNSNLDALASSSSENFVVIPDIDMEDERAGQKMAELLPPGKVDYLLLSAGYFTTETFDELNFAEQRKMMEICAFAPLRITQQLYKSGHVAAGTKIAMITSEGGSIGLRTEAEGGANYGHHMSKCAQNMMGKIMAIDLKPRGIPLVMLHPGFLRTEMTEHYSMFYEEFGAVSPDIAVPPILTALRDVSIDDVPGKFIAPMGSKGLGLGVNALPGAHLDPFGELPW